MSIKLFNNFTITLLTCIKYSNQYGNTYILLAIYITGNLRLPGNASNATEERSDTRKLQALPLFKSPFLPRASIIENHLSFSLFSS